MNSLPKCELLEYNKDTLYEVRKLYDLHKPLVMKQAVDILEEWVKVQHHFTKRDFDREYLERTIIFSKGSIERAKERMDKKCTLRTLMPHLFGIYDLKEYMKTDLEFITQAFLPKMTSDNSRVYMLRNDGKTFTPTMFLSYTKCLLALCEYMKRYDYPASFYVVLDYMEVNIMELASKLTVHELQEISAYCLEGCGFRVSEIIILSNSKLIDIVVKILKQVLKKKLGDRISVRNDRRALTDVFDKDIIPEEYGGTEKPLADLQTRWLDNFTSGDMMEYLKEINAARTNESQRQTDKFNEQYMGMPGTFRTLSVD